MSRPIIDKAIDTSYEIICALLRRAPRSAYLLFDAHPAIAAPYTDIDEMANTYRSPTSRLAIENQFRVSPVQTSRNVPSTSAGAAEPRHTRSMNGMTAHRAIAGKTLSAGATVCQKWFALSGMMSSLKIILMLSAIR